MAAKEKETEEVSGSQQNQTLAFEKRLKAEAAKPTGLYLKINTEEQPVRISAKLIGKVFENSAWVGFCYDGNLVRTMEIPDRNYAWNAIMGSGDELHKARFYLPNGGRIASSAVLTTEAKLKAPPMPRSRRDWNHTRTFLLARQMAAEHAGVEE